MARVAFLVTVLAVLCYTSQAIPVQTENAQVELPNEIIDGVLKTMKEKMNDVINKLKDRMGKLEYEFQVAKFNGESILREKIESLKKLLLEGKINIEEFIEKIKGEKQKIETDYQLSLSFSIKLLKPLIKIIGFEVVAPMVKGKIQEMLNKRQSETYGIMGNIGGIIKNIGEKVDEKVGEMVKEGTKILDKTIDKTIDKVKEMEKDLKHSVEGMVDAGIDGLDKVTKEIRDQLNDMKNTITGEKYQQLQQAIMTDEAGEGLKGIIGHVGGIIKETGNLIGNILGMPSNIGNRLRNRKGGNNPEDGKKTDKSEEKYQQPQQAIIIDKVGGVIEGTMNIVGDLVTDMGKVIGSFLDMPSNMVKGLWNRKGGKKPEDGKKTDKSEEKENNIEVPEKEKENSIEVPEKEKENSIEVPEKEKENSIEVPEKEKENNIEVPEEEKENSIEVPENED